MSDYIERQAAIRALCDGCVDEGYCGEKDLAGRYACDDVPKLLAIHAADVREVKRGKWICDGYWSRGCGMGEEYGNYWKCSVCDKIVREDYAKCGFYYCPYCGADMREETDV